MSTRQSFLSALALSLVVAAGGLAAGNARAELFTTDRFHFRNGVPEPRSSVGSGSQPDFKGPAYRGRVLIRREAALQQTGAPSGRLSKACREGRFAQAVDRRYVAVMGKHIYGAALGQAPMLYDPERLGQAGIVYVFVGQGTTNCRVYPAGGING